MNEHFFYRVYENILPNYEGEILRIHYKAMWFLLRIWFLEGEQRFFVIFNVVFLNKVIILKLILNYIFLADILFSKAEN